MVPNIKRTELNTKKVKQNLKLTNKNETKGKQVNHQKLASFLVSKIHRKNGDFLKIFMH